VHSKEEITMSFVKTLAAFAAALVFGAALAGCPADTGTGTADDTGSAA
jgi:hypothetical protein